MVELIRQLFQFGAAARAHTAPPLPLRAHASRCFECGSAGPLHKAHVVPAVVGGTKTVPLCHACHGKSHGLDFHDHNQLIREGQRRAKAEGRHVGRAPFGFKPGRHPGYLVECPREQFILHRAEELRASGKTWAQVAEAMNRSQATRHPAGLEWEKTRLRKLFTDEYVEIRERARRVCEAHP